MFEYRDENFRLLDSLTYLADQNGLAVLSFQQTPDRKWYVDYFDRSRWLEPQRVALPTDYIYEKQLKDYIRRCTVSSKMYASFGEMVTGEIQRLKERIP